MFCFFNAVIIELYSIFWSGTVLKARSEIIVYTLVLILLLSYLPAFNYLKIFELQGGSDVLYFIGGLSE